ncbi:MAG: hypothetical protein Ct9H300mP14_16500 [Gammaproteobacteria bacterium]|nr:MAG: hypothetical protein Ct9H300mP14_16500 [Gammaproteobacteria bacterium]
MGGLAVVTTGAFLAGTQAIDSGVLPLLTILAMAAFLPVSEIAQVGPQLAEHWAPHGGFMRSKTNRYQ